MFILDILFITFYNITFIFDLTNKDYVMAWISYNILNFKIIFVKDSVLFIKLRFLLDLLNLFFILSSYEILIALNVSIKIDHPIVLIKLNFRLLR